MADISKCIKVVCEASDEALESISSLSKEDLLLIYDQIEPHQFIARSRIGNMLLSQGVDRESIPYLKSDVPFFKKTDDDLLAHIKTNVDPVSRRVVISILQRRRVKNYVIEEVLKELDAKNEEFKQNYRNLEYEAMDDASLRVACKNKKEACIELLKRGVSIGELVELLNEPIEKLFSEMSEKERWYVASSDSFVCTDELLERMNTANLLKLCEESMRIGVHCTDEKPVTLRGVVGLLRRRQVKSKILDQVEKELDAKEEEGNYENAEYEAHDNTLLIDICRKEGKRYSQERFNASIELLKRGYSARELLKLLPNIENIKQIFSSMAENALWYIVSSDTFFCQQELFECMKTKNLLQLCTDDVIKKNFEIRKVIAAILLRRRAKGVDKVLKGIEEEENKLDYKNEKCEAMDVKSLETLCKTTQDRFHQERRNACVELLKRGSSFSQLSKLLPAHDSKILASLPQKALVYIVSSDTFSCQEQVIDLLNTQNLLLLCGKKKDPDTLKVFVKILESREVKDPFADQVLKEIKREEKKLDYKNEKYEAMDDKSLKDICRNCDTFFKEGINAVIELLKRGLTSDELKKFVAASVKNIYSSLSQDALWYIVSSDTFYEQELLEFVSTHNLLLLCSKKRTDVATIKVIVAILECRTGRNPVIDEVLKEIEQEENKLDYKNKKCEVMDNNHLKVLCKKDEKERINASIELLKRGLTFDELKKVLPPTILVDEIFSHLSQKALWYIVSSDSFRCQRTLLDCLQNQYLLMLCGKPGLHGVIKKDAATLKIILEIFLQRKFKDPFISQVQMELNEEENRLNYKNEEYAALDDNALRVKCQKRGGQFHQERLNALIELLHRGFTTQQLQKLFPPKMEIISLLTQKALWYIASSEKFTCQQELLECMKTPNLLKLCGPEESQLIDFATRKVTVAILLRRKVKDKLLDQAIEKLDEEESKIEYKNMQYEAMDDESLKKACSKVGSKFFEERLSTSIELLKRGLSIQEWGKLLPCNFTTKETLPLIKDNALWYILSSQSCLCQQELLECMKTANLLKLCSNQEAEVMETKDPATIKIIVDILQQRGVNDTILDEALKKADEEEKDLNYKNEAFEALDDKSLMAMCKKYGIVFHKVRLGAYIELLKRGLSAIDLKRLLPPNITTKLIFSQMTQKALWYIVSSEKFCQLELLEFMNTHNLLKLCGTFYGKKDFTTLKVIIEILQRRKAEDPIIDKVLKELEEEENKLNFKNPECETMDDISLSKMCKKVGSSFRHERLHASIELLKRGTSAQELKRLLPVSIKEILSSIPEKAFWYIVTSETFFSQQMLLECMKTENLLLLLSVKKDPVTLTSICTILRSRQVQNPLIEKIAKELEEEANGNYKNVEYESMTEQNLKDKFRKIEDKFHPERLSAAIELLKRGMSTEQIKEMLAPQLQIKPILLSLTQKALWYIATSEKFICQQELLEYMKTNNLLKLCGVNGKKGPAMRQVIIGILKRRNIADELFEILEADIKGQDYKNPEYESMSNELLLNLCKNPAVHFHQDRLNASVELLKRGVKPEVLAELHISIGNIATQISEKARVYVVSAASSICIPELINCMSTPNLLKLCNKQAASQSKQNCALKQLLLRNVSSIPVAMHGACKGITLKSKVIENLSIDQLKNLTQIHLAKKIQEQAIEELRKRGVELPKIPPPMGEEATICVPPEVPAPVLIAQKEIANKIRQQLHPKVEKAKDDGKSPLLPTLGVAPLVAKKPPLLPGMASPTLYNPYQFEKPSENATPSAGGEKVQPSLEATKIPESKKNKRPHESAEFELKKSKQSTEPLQLPQSISPVTGYFCSAVNKEPITCQQPPSAVQRPMPNETKSNMAKTDVRQKIDYPPKIENLRWVNSFTKLGDPKDLKKDEKIKDTPFHEKFKKNQVYVKDSKKTPPRAKTRSLEKVIKLLQIIDETEARRQKAQELLGEGETKDCFKSDVTINLTDDSRHSSVEKLRQRGVDKSSTGKEKHVDSRQSSLEKLRQKYSHVDKPSSETRIAQYVDKPPASNVDGNLPFYLATQTPGALNKSPPHYYPDHEFNYWEKDRENTHVPIGKEPDCSQYSEERNVNTSPPKKRISKEDSPLLIKVENVHSPSPSHNSKEFWDDILQNYQLHSTVESRKRPYSPRDSETFEPKVPKMASPPSKNFKVILSKDDYNEPFSGKDLEMFEILLVNIIQFTGGLPPLIEETVRTKNKLVITCANEYSQNWLLKYVPRLKLDGVPLCAVKEEPPSYELVFPPHGQGCRGIV